MRRFRIRDLGPATILPLRFDKLFCRRFDGFRVGVKVAKAQQAKHAIFRVCCLLVEQPCQRLLLPHVDSFCLRIGSKGVQSAEGNVCRSKRAFFRGWPVCGTLPVIGLFIEYQVRGYCRSHVIWFSVTSVQCPKCVACARVAAALSTSFQVVCFATGQIGSRVVELCL